MVISVIKKGIVLIWKKIWSPIHPNDGEFAPIGQVIPLDKEEITNIDKIQDKYLTGSDGMNSANYISDTVLYIRLLRILTKEELLTSERLFIIEILSKYEIYLENND